MIYYNCLFRLICDLVSYLDWKGVFIANIFISDKEALA